MAAPQLRVIDGGSPKMRVEEARIEVLALMDEVADFAIQALPVLNEWQSNVTKLARLAVLARGEFVELNGGDAA